MSRAAFPAEDLYSWFHKHSSSDGLFCVESSNLNLTARAGSNLDYDTCISSDLIGQTMSDSNCRQLPGSGPQALETISHKGASALLWLGIKRCLSSLAVASDKAQQTQAGQQHDIGFGFGNDSGDGDLSQVIDPRRAG